MSVFSSILSGGVDKVIGAVGTVLDNLFTSTDEKNKADIAKTQIVLAAEQARNETAARLEEAYLADAANLREQIKLEIQSEDAYVRRARPSAIWIGVLILGFNFVVTPIVLSVASIFDHEIRVTPMPLPEEFWWVWSGLVLGYGVMRSFDKAKQTKNGNSK